MRLMSIFSGKGFVMYNKELAHSVSVNGAIIFGQLCSSYESFGSKNMLTIRDDKEYFFLTADTLEEETALSYKQQLKATKDLEEGGYIETRVMGVPSKKYFHITDKIEKELIGIPRSAKKEDLEQPTNVEPEGQKVTPSHSERENLALTKGNGKVLQKGSSIKKKNKKEQHKDNNNIFVNKESVNNDEIINQLTNEYRLKGLSKEVCLRVVNEVIQNNDIENFGAYLRTCLENTLHRSKIRNGEIDPVKNMKERHERAGIPFFDWLNA